MSDVAAHLVDEVLPKVLGYPRRHRPRLLISLSACTLTLACGGGSGSDASTTLTATTITTGDVREDGTSTGDTSTGDETTTDDGSDLCYDYVQEHYDYCYPNRPSYILEVALWCAECRAYYTNYTSPECLAAWEASIACRTAADCGEASDQCAGEINQRIQACSGQTNGACGDSFLGMMVCISKLDCPPSHAS